MKARYIPNILSVFRLLMALAFAAVFVLLPDKLYIAVIVFVVGGITDITDGILARRFNWITTAGKILDPLADKLMQIVALVCTVAGGLVPWWLLMPIVLKELTMAAGSIIYYRMFGTVGVSKSYGKSYTVLFYVLIAAIIVFDGWFATHEWVKYVLCLVTAASGWMAIVLYYITYLKGNPGKKNKPENKS